MEPLQPKGPDEIPVEAIEVVPRPAPPRPPGMSWQEKPIWESKTILSLTVAIGALVLGWFGIDGIDLAAIAEDNVVTLGEIVTLAFAIAAVVFRINATGPIATPGKSKPKPEGG